MAKKVNFNLSKNTYHTTYSSSEYNRSQIDSTIYLYCYKRITDKEMNTIINDLNIFKSKEMIIHIDSIQNTKLIGN
jgi:hypothetical protein